ncbi:hypothetical protein JVX90_04215 [Gordonia sp. PDNC005]|uniref:hypothetical protein n=1 Tax=Gordonia sp. PDNC005 TaxID=2811424 RepID=UPI0019652E27|nr:hypothetical protein [Gordonia sp. PDNC005]QRY63444.1 hypothetical protein JVX90_04215 [Gordonia sp. PDNC005]
MGDYSTLDSVAEETGALESAERQALGFELQRKAFAEMGTNRQVLDRRRVEDEYVLAQ